VKKRFHFRRHREEGAGSARRGDLRRLRLPRSLRTLAMTAGVGLFPTFAKAVEIKPVVNAQLLGGQYFYNDANNAFGALASLSASPYMKFNDEWSLVPLYSGNYRGTKQVTDLVGGGTLFQDSQDHTISTKLVRSFSNDWKLKGVAGYGAELLRETKDEAWGKGLYDNRKIFGGVEAERDWAKDQYLRAAYDYYQIHFPNYTSLSSQADNSGLGRELDEPDALNTKNHSMTLSGQIALPANGRLEPTYSYTRRSYDNQFLVNNAGALVNELRHDSIHSIALQGTWPVWVESERRLFGGLTYGWTGLFSNQNHYDANQVFYNANYYAYKTNSMQTDWTLLVGEDPWMLRFTANIARQKYAGRRVQDATGVYGTDVTHVDSAYVSWTFSYPIAKGFHVMATASLGWDDSNNQYNAVYQYHYHTGTYLLGFSYAY
jgi:hypothetical protein